MRFITERICILCRSYPIHQYIGIILEILLRGIMVAATVLMVTLADIIGKGYLALCIDIFHKASFLPQFGQLSLLPYLYFCKWNRYSLISLRIYCGCTLHFCTLWKFYGTFAVRKCNSARCICIIRSGFTIKSVLDFLYKGMLKPAQLFKRIVNRTS